MSPKTPMSAASVASVESRRRSSPRAKPSSITILRPWPITSTMPAESAIATAATAMRPRYGASSRKSGRSLSSSAAPRPSAAALDDRAGDGARHEERAPVLRDLRADLEGEMAAHRAVRGEVHGAVAAEHPALERELAIGCAPVSGGVLARELRELRDARALPGRVRLHHGDEVHVAHGTLGELELALHARGREERLEAGRFRDHVEVAGELAGHG